MALISTDWPEGHKNHGKPFAISGTAKAAGLIFKPWEMVKASTARVEGQIASYAREHGIPVRVFDWQDEALVAGYFTRHAEEVPQIQEGGLPDPTAVAKMIARSMTPDIPAKEIPQFGPGTPEGQIPAGEGRHRPQSGAQAAVSARKASASESAGAAR